ncbi:type VI secretion system accessory protein TagJ [Achromobacter seleniivolatilans]|uniref:Type VI secretion system accessory protein TagJ n=1 Tax=Achromobacter seleniivolatilans TaxID=3047478 RepID=A0ABY9M0J3_9BURK|nr:type VI secretion system accessory protein TagJ [Achromobacter sp. R39]WMD20260.1 type VI secretion system accessory protein TagJ [Achromobacter sp. R39]
MLKTQAPLSESRDSLRQLLHGRSLASAIEEATGKIQHQPGSIDLRWLLFQLLCIRGDWVRALKQLQIWASLNSEHLRTAQMLRELLRAEAYRGEVMKGLKEPGWLDEPAPWSKQLAQAIGAMAIGDVERSDELRGQALDLAPDAAGHANPGNEFAWISDSDSRLGPHCELMFSGGYRWVPFSRIAKLSFPPVEGALDLIWRQCKVTLRDQSELSAYMPTRYPFVREETDAQSLAAVTTWSDQSQTAVIGTGQRTWITDSGDIAMLSVLSMHFEGQSIECA